MKNKAVFAIFRVRFTAWRDLLLVNTTSVLAAITNLWMCEIKTARRSTDGGVVEGLRLVPVHLWPVAPTPAISSGLVLRNWSVEIITYNHFGFPRQLAGVPQIALHSTIDH